MTAAFAPTHLKETLPPDVVVATFLAFRAAAHDEVIQSRTMARPVVRLRHELMWLLRDLTHLSLESIGQVIGGRDATTVRHGIDQIADRIASDDGYRREMRFQRLALLKAAGGMPPALRMTAARGVLADRGLTDADARLAALQLLGGDHA